MDTEFWLQRWRDGQTGFHQTRVMPLLQKYWPALSVPQAGRVLVPLAGKSLAMAWLAGPGHGGLGVALSALAVEQRSETRRVGYGCVRQCRSRWCPAHAKKKHITNR